MPICALAVMLGGIVVLSACSPSPSASPATGANPTQASAQSTAASNVAQAVTRVSANNASVAELQQAFEAAGIPNAARWAREVDEYRPYPTDDPSFAKLRGELAKYNPSPDVLQKILATLTL